MSDYRLYVKSKGPNRRKCGVLGCPHVEYNSSVNYFTFPSNNIRARMWIKICGNPALNGANLQKVRYKYTVCDRHFAVHQFRTVLKNRLVPNEIPTLFLPPGCEDFIQQYDKNESVVLAKESIMTRIENEIQGRTERKQCGNDHVDKFVNLVVEFLTGKKAVIVDVIVENKPEGEVFLSEADALKEPEYTFNSVLMFSENGNIEICRMCMNESHSFTNFNQINPRFGKTFAEIIEYMFPKYNINLYRNPSICASCSELVTNSYELKKTWEHTEDVLEKYKKSVFFYQVRNLGIHCVTKKIADPLLDHDYTETPKMLQESPVAQWKPNRVILPSSTDLFDPKVDQYFTHKASRVSVLKTSKKDWGTGPFLCNFCGKLYNKRRIFRHHVTQHKLANSGHSFKCAKCSTLFSSELVFDKHRRSCEKRRKKPRAGQCHICGKQLKSGMFAHLLQHRKELWTKECRICDKKFAMECLLRRHMRSHRAGEFICRICGKAMKHKDSLKAHVRIVHENRERCWCNICDKSFRDKYKLATHLQRIHALQTAQNNIVAPL